MNSLTFCLFCFRSALICGKWLLTDLFRSVIYFNKHYLHSRSDYTCTNLVNTMVSEETTTTQIGKKTPHRLHFNASSDSLMCLRAPPVITP